MNTVDNEQIAAFDVDNTLIVRSTSGSLQLPYGGSIVSFSPIMAHVELLKQYKERGFYIIVWSHNGVRHAKNVVEALKLNRFVDQVMCKVSKVVDDKDNVSDIVGTRVFIA